MLLNLLTDEHELVVYAARESCKHISLIRFAKDVDFGPQMNSSHEERGSARELWEGFFKQKENTPKDADKQVDKTFNKLANPRMINGKTVQEILGVE